ncbi:MAG: PadR family transcriptional regulator [Clostridia bacterium]|nr:PadR family transcriptional regulator [Clostridia bacterium]
MSLSHSILGFLSYGSMTGYDLSKAFDSSVNFFWYAQASQIYLELNKLEKKQFVSCERVLQTEKPNKKVYSITEYGRNEFMKWLCDTNTLLSKNKKDTFLMKVFFSGNNPPDKSIAMLRQFSEDCKRSLSEMKNIPKSIQNYGESVEPYQAIYWQFAADFGNSYIQMCMDWADRSIQRLEKLL